MEDPRLPEDGVFPIQVRVRTRWSDADCQDVLNNAVYLTLLEEARFAWCRKQGLLEDGRRFPFVLARTNLRFVSPGCGGEELVVELAVTGVGRSSFLQAARIRTPEGEVRAEAEALLVAWDNRRGRKAETLEPGLRAALEGAMRHPA